MFVVVIIIIIYSYYHAGTANFFKEVVGLSFTRTLSRTGFGRIDSRAHINHRVL